MTATLLLAAIVAGRAATAEVYFTGEGTAALIAGGTVRTEGRLFPCVSCHGADGRGTAEGATEIPPIIWQALSSATDRRPAYDAEGFAVALRAGLRPDGTPLSAAMPRYEMVDTVLAALVATLGRIEAEDRAAFGPRAVRVAAPEGDPRRRGYAAAAATFNAAGGAFGRVIDIVGRAGHPAARQDRRARDEGRRGGGRGPALRAHHCRRAWMRPLADGSAAGRAGFSVASARPCA